MKAEIFVNISATLQNIFNFGENEFYKLAKDDKDLYLYGKNAFVSFEDQEPRLHELSFPDSSFAQKSCLRAQLKTCSNFVHHVSTIGSSRLVCGSYFAQPKCEFNNNYFEAHNFISDGSESSAEKGFVRKLGQHSSFLAIAEVSRGSHSGIFTLEKTTGEKPFSLTDKPLDDLFPAQVRLHAALNGNKATYLLGTENEDSPFLAKLCLNSDEHQAPVIESPTSWSSVVRANLRCCDEERNCRFTRPIETRTLRLKNENELLLVLFQSQENDESALCMFSSNELDAFFGSSCSSSRQSSTLTTTALLTTQAQSFDVDVKRAALRIALMETDEQALTKVLVSKVTVRLDENNGPISVNANFRAALNLSSHGESKIHQIAVFKDSVMIRGEQQVLKMDFEACGVYKTCGTCVAIGDVDCGWDNVNQRCSSKINASNSCEISPVPVFSKTDFLDETLESIRINTSDVEVFDDFHVLLEGKLLPRDLFPGLYHKDRSLLILNVLDIPESGEYTVNFLFRDFVVFKSSFSITSKHKDIRAGPGSPPIQEARSGSVLGIILGVTITFIFGILMFCCVLKGRMQRERSKSLELAKQQRPPPAGQSHSGSEFEIALLKKSDSITTREKFIQSREQIDGGSDGRSDRDNSEAFMSCSSRPESVQSDERNAAMVIFPDGTIKKIAAEKVQKMSNHMADVTLDFAENEKFIHGTLRKSQKKKKETN